MAKMSTQNIGNVTMQQMIDAGLNAFALTVLVESYAPAGRPEPPSRLDFVFRGVRLTLEPYLPEKKEPEEAFKLWYAGQVRSGEHPDVVWDFQGIFSTEALAKQACRDRTYFVAPIALDQELPHEQFETPGYYPIGQKIAEFLDELISTFVADGMNWAQSGDNNLAMECNDHAEAVRNLAVARGLIEAPPADAPSGEHAEDT